jgi:MFS family permease
MSGQNSLRSLFAPAVIVGALGYFVDIYDLTLFGIVRKVSLEELGFSGDQLVTHGASLMNFQMIGMLIGGLIAGIYGDRKGRVQLLFGSILLYSLANIANGFVTSLEAYKVCRFIAGLGLAGEIGGSITLVSEVLSKEMRGYGTMIVATVGVFGAVVGGMVAGLTNWRIAFFIGGGLGLMLLVLRISVAESGMFNNLKVRRSGVSRGNFLYLFTSWKRFLKYLRCILIGVPSWYVVGVLGVFSPEFAKALGIKGDVSAMYAIPLIYLGLTLGDLMSGMLSQLLKTRRKVVFGFLVLTLTAIGLYFSARGLSAELFYAIIFLLGVGIGYWAIFITIGAEQFGTNIRATVATTVPNFVRGATVPIVNSFVFLKSTMGIIPGGIIVGVVCVLIAMVALIGMEETYGKDLDYEEPV